MGELRAELLFPLGQLPVDRVFTARGRRSRFPLHPRGEAETAEGVNYLAKARAALKDSGLPAERQPRAALASYLHVLMASDEFLFVD